MASSTTNSYLGINQVSFSNAPQAKDDTYTFDETKTEGVICLDVMANDLGGNSKTLFSVDDGVETPQEFMKDLSTTDVNVARDSAAAAENKTAGGASIWIANGKVYIDFRSNPDYLAKINSLAVGDSATDSFVYAIRLGNGTLSYARVTFTITGTNDGPVA
ncbi:VCBS domain-containing protein, partial [Ramlibacter sp. AN1015]|uniref:VCBS domain-containing protein n=1 Tax=Ramlibacter sp. AN1015 TaxID=3133428 RepID=UPI0030BD14A7